MRLLIVEDSKRLRDALAAGLSRLGYAVEVSGHGEEALFLAGTRAYDVIVLDLSLPGLDGIEILKRLRADGIDAHVLVLTARDTVSDRVRGLRSGADDYLVKPFAFDELVARIQSLTRRRYGARDPRWRLGEVEIDTSAQAVLVRGEAVALTRREYALLEFLAANDGRAVSRQELREHIWGDQPLASNAVDSAVCCLRRKLADADITDLIDTKRGFGYRLAVLRDA